MLKSPKSCVSKEFKGLIGTDRGPDAGLMHREKTFEQQVSRLATDEISVQAT